MLIYKQLTFHYGAIKPYIDSVLRNSFIALTFHYGAIKPLAQEMLMANADKLTFHYGAIKPFIIQFAELSIF